MSDPPPYDNQKLRAWIDAPMEQRRGLRFAHLHLSAIDVAKAVDRDAAMLDLMSLTRDDVHTGVADKMSAPMTTPRHFQVFVMSNGDITMVYRGLKWSAVAEVCRRIEAGVRSKGVLIALNPYGERSLYSILEFAAYLPQIARYLDGLDARAEETRR